MKKKIYKSGKSGKFVSKDEVQANPDETYSQTVGKISKSDLSDAIWRFLTEKGIEPNQQISALGLPELFLEFAEVILEVKQGVAEAEVVEVK